MLPNVPSVTWGKAVLNLLKGQTGLGHFKSQFLLTMVSYSQQAHLVKATISIACIVADTLNLLYKVSAKLVQNIVFESRRVARTYVDVFDWLNLTQFMISLI